MKRVVLEIVAVFALAGCSGSVTPPNPADFGDPIARVINNANFYENGQNFDIGIGLFRFEDLNGSSNTFAGSNGRMAFELNGVPSMAEGVEINGVSLPWTTSGSGGIGYDNSYASIDSNLYGSPDKMSYTYSNFDGGSFQDTVPIAPIFGAITAPNSISASRGCDIYYQYFVPGDSLNVFVNSLDQGFFMTVPDNGTINILPNQLPYDSSVAKHGYFFSFIRTNWTTRTSPSGKRIGIYSSIESDFGVPASN